MNRLILSTGGTGGHIFPALAVAETVRARMPACRILFVGGNRGPERLWAERSGLEFAALPARGVLGRGVRSLGALFWLGRSLFQAWRLLRSFRPDVVLGLGGYAGFSCTMAATLTGIPTAVHEQNSVLGVSNRVLARRVDRVLTSFADMDLPEGIRQKAVLTGNPIRNQIRESATGDRTPGRNILVMGGSQGASALNRVMVRELDAFRSQGLRIWHQTGKDEFETVRAAYAEKYPEARVDVFIEDMRAAYEFADLVICRAGATTIAELTTAGKPSVLIPFPYATHDHQLRNARFLEQGGAAMVLPQNQLDSVSLAAVTADLFQVSGRLTKMSRAARAMGHPDAGEKVVDELVRLAARAA
jgi:UDP-N-acetylglucosamine--N-acetylmuramyl-(pentapeptide) pyrophosphoryl-undecaprenol N-acetylglucosamine transferase